MVYRPISVTVIAWLLIILGVFGLFGAAQMILRPNVESQKILAESPIPISVQRGMMVGGTLVELVCGVFMLRGRNWARLFFVVWSALSLSVWGAVSPHKLFMIPGVVMFAIEVFFLFRPAANAFFANNGANIDPTSLPSTRRVFGIMFYVFAGFLFTCMGMTTLMTAPALGAKTFMLLFFLLPFSICLAIGKWLAAGNWKLDVGIVFALGSLGGASMVVMMLATFSQPEFMRNMSPDRLEHVRDMLSDYTFAGFWFGAWLLLGIALILLGRRPAETAKFPPIVGR